MSSREGLKSSTISHRLCFPPSYFGVDGAYFNPWFNLQNSFRRTVSQSLPCPSLPCSVNHLNSLFQFSHTPSGFNEICIPGKPWPLKHTFIKCFKILRHQVLSFELLSGLSSFSLSRCYLLFFVSTSLARLVLLPFSCRIYTPLFHLLLCSGLRACLPWNTMLPTLWKCCSWELSSAKQSRIITFLVLHTVVLLTQPKATVTFLPTLSHC